MNPRSDETADTFTLLARMVLFRHTMSLLIGGAGSRRIGRRRPAVI